MADFVAPAAPAGAAPTTCIAHLPTDVLPPSCFAWLENSLVEVLFITETHTSELRRPQAACRLGRGLPPPPLPLALLDADEAVEANEPARWSMLLRLAIVDPRRLLPRDSSALAAVPASLTARLGRRAGRLALQLLADAAVATSCSQASVASATQASSACMATSSGGTT